MERWLPYPRKALFQGSLPAGTWARLAKAPVRSTAAEVGFARCDTNATHPAQGFDLPSDEEGHRTNHSCIRISTKPKVAVTRIATQAPHPCGYGTPWI